MTNTTDKPRTSPFPEEIQIARKYPNGWVYRIGGNFGPTDAIPPEAVAGAWKVDATGMIVGDFEKNPKYDGQRFPPKSPSKS